MTDNEIIEALGFCEGYNGVSFCSICPLFGKDNCTNILSHEAYNIINRQKAEIERLNIELQTMRGAANCLKMHYNAAKAEIEQLKAKNEILIKNADTAFQDGLNEAQDLYASQIRNEVGQEVIKEFVERLKAKFDIAGCIVTVDNNDIDNLVKEMSGDPRMVYAKI